MAKGAEDRETGFSGSRLKTAGDRMNYCSQCGAPVSYVTPEGDDRPRFVCQTCGVVHYENPKLVVGSIPEWEDKILLCRRAIEPRYGKWTLPAGYMENGETASHGAAREAYEEAFARIEILSPYALFNLIYVNQVYIMFRARLLNQDYRPGQESLEVRLFTKRDIPWDELAFPVVEETLKHYFLDRFTGEFPFFTGDITKRLRSG